MSRSHLPPNPRLERTPVRAPLSRKVLNGFKRQQLSETKSNRGRRCMLVVRVGGARLRCSAECGQSWLRRV